MKTLIVVPAFNEKKSIGNVIVDLRKHGLKSILVVDDGSTDDTFKIANKSKVISLQHLLNRGLGAALGTGFEFARRHDYDCLVTFDADGQHQAKDIKLLINPLKNGQADVTIGKRVVEKESSPLDRKIMNFLANIVTYSLFGIWTSDSQSGLRAFNRKAIENIAIKTDRMEVSSEFFREIKKHKLRLVEVPIQAVYTKYSRESSSQETFSSVKIPMRLILGQFRQ